MNLLVRAAAAATVAVVAAASPAWAWFSDDAALTASVTAHTVLAPGSIRCTPTDGGVVLSWEGDPRYTYQVTVTPAPIRTSGPMAGPGSTVQLTVTTENGKGHRYQAAVTAALTVAPSWSSTPVTASFSGGTGANKQGSCG